MIPIKLMGATYQIPGSWDEVTVGQFLRLMENREEAAGNPALVLSILSGIDYALLLNADPKQIEGNVLSRLTFLGKDVGLEKFMRPKTVNVGGKVYNVPTDLKAETWGQKITAQMLINQAATDNAPLISIAADLVAVYLQPEIDGPKFDDKKTKQVAQLILQTGRLCEIWPVAAFFLKLSKRSAKQKTES